MEKENGQKKRCNVSIVQISRIQQRRGPLADLPKGTPENPIGLREGEIGLASDTGAVFIGTPNLLQVERRKPGVVADGEVTNDKGQTRTGRFPYANTQLLTEWTRNTEELIKYVYRYRDMESNNEFPGPGSGLEWTYDQARPWNEDNEVISRTLQERLDEVVSVKSYGAKGDGVTDDTYAIWRAAVDVVRVDPAQYSSDTAKKTSARRLLYFPAGTYKITRPIILPPYSTWVGDGIDKTIIKLVTASTDFTSRCVVETVDDGYCSTDGLETLQVRWTSSTPSEQILERTEYQIGNATTVSSGTFGALLPNDISVSNMSFLHAGHLGGSKPARDIVRLNRSSRTRWFNVRFEGSNYVKTDYYSYTYRKAITDIIVTNGGSGYVAATTRVTITGDGQGAVAVPVINSGVITRIDIVEPGQGYSAAVIAIETFNGGPGSGAAATAITADMPYDIIVRDDDGSAMYNNGGDNAPAANSIAVFIDGLGSLENGTIVNPTDHIFVGCQFNKTTYGLSMTDQVSQVALIGCTFEEHYRAISIGEDLWWATAETTQNVPLNGTVASLTTILGRPVTTGNRVKLKGQTTASENNKTYRVAVTTNPLGDTYQLIEVKNWGLHTNGDEQDRLLPGKFGGPSDIKIANCSFKKIIESGLFVEKGRNVSSTNNSFDQTVGRGYTANWTAGPERFPMIYFGPRAHGCSSVGDWFGRDDRDATGGVNRRRIVYPTLHDHMIVNTQDSPTIPGLVSGVVKTTLGTTDPLSARPGDIIDPEHYYPELLPVVIPPDTFPTTAQLASEFRHSGIELPISTYVDIGAVMTEVADCEAYIIDYALSNETVRASGQLHVIAKFVPEPGTSIVTLKDTKRVSIGDTQVRFVALAKKYQNGKTYVKILYNNVNGSSIDMTYSVRRWRL